MPPDANAVTLFLCGDVMLGRGIDQVLRQPSEPELHEPFIEDARDYVRLAEERNGPIPRGVGFDYVWGDALEELARAAPDARIINLETSVTRSDEWLSKGINYRLHPDNVRTLNAASIDCCILSNNHVLDYGRRGLLETLDTLHAAGLATAGAGRNVVEARAPAALHIGARARLLVIGIGFSTSGIPRDWRATKDTPGVNLLEESPEVAAARISHELAKIRRPNDLLIASVHWGDNWGFRIPDDQRRFARALIDYARADVIHGHSSHHAKAIEVYRDKLVLYGCGDFLNDYEGIRGHEGYRSDLSLMYFVKVDPGSGTLRELRMKAFHTRRFRLERASEADASWLRNTLDREGAPLGTGVEMNAEGTLQLKWG